jgi:RNA-directed DNA polymerase
VNEGRYTAGVDKVAIPREKEEQEAVRLRLYQEIDISRKPSPIKRVFIPKPNGKRRPLGIPTLSDRINHQIIRQAIEPICEYHFHGSSHGFRPKRGCHDAMSDIFNKMSHKTSKQWVIEGDIKGCFDNINHNYITDTLKSWHVTDGINQSIGQMLKSKIFDDGNITDSEMGTPQGGVISPLLANVALTSLDEYCQQFGRKSVNKDGRYAIVSPIVRYADDFVIVCENEPEAEIIKAKVAQQLKEKVGLELSGEKTHITHISKGFNFLGFNFRKYRSGESDNDDMKLLIKPQAEKVDNFRYKLKNILKVVSPQDVVQKLNPVITGWGMYYRHVVSKVIFSKLDNDIWRKLYRWTKGRHSDIPTARMVVKSFSRNGVRKWDFSDKAGKLVSRLSTIPIKRFIKINNDHRVYDVKSREYWELREYQNTKDSILGTGVLSALFGKQKGKCAYCKQPITKEAVNTLEFHKHHMKPRSEGGDEKSSNLRLLHTICHQDIHAIYTRKGMSEYTDNGIDYLRLMKPSLNHQS